MWMQVRSDNTAYWIGGSTHAPEGLSLISAVSIGFLRNILIFNYNTNTSGNYIACKITLAV